VIVEWNGYPLKRRKKFAKNYYLECGLGPLLEGMERYPAGVEIDVTLMINCSGGEWYYPLSPMKKHHRTKKEEYLALKDRYSFVSDVCFRGNAGMDIGAYNDALFSLRENGYGGEVCFMNSSVRSPDRENWMLDYHQILEENNYEGICGISLNSHNTIAKPAFFSPHVQSFFIHTTMKLMDSVFPQGFPTGEGTLNKLDLIEKGEIGISKKVLESGFGIASRAFPDFFYRQGMEWTIPEGDLRSLPEFGQYTNQL
jgi:hypothetical protein